jgi:uncharacterized protein (TIGR03437 family)
LVVQPKDQPAVKATFNVSRNAPGLFNQRIEDRAFVLALRENGSVSSPENPVRRGETVTLLGTGLGPYRRIPPDGFMLPETPDFQLADPVEILLGETVLQPLYSGVAKQGVGLNAVKFRISEDVSSAAHELKVRVNGRESNAALLPIE